MRLARPLLGYRYGTTDVYIGKLYIFFYGTGMVLLYINKNVVHILLWYYCCVYIVILYTHFYGTMDSSLREVIGGGRGHMI